MSPWGGAGTLELSGEEFHLVSKRHSLIYNFLTFKKKNAVNASEQPIQFKKKNKTLTLDLNTDAADTAWGLAVGQVDSKRVMKRFVQLPPLFNQAGKKEHQRLSSCVFQRPCHDL